MKLLGKPISEVSAEDIQSLIDNSVSESDVLDYKRELPDFSVEKKRIDFFADITSFANTRGGVVIYGIEEKKDERGRNTGTPEKVVGLVDFNEDKLKLQIEQIVDSGIEPKLRGLRFETRTIDGQELLLIGIGISYSAPHLIWFERNGKFYRRNSSGKYQMDIYEIRREILQRGLIESRADEYRKNRIPQIWKTLEPGKSLRILYCLHLIPIGENRDQLDVVANTDEFLKLKLSRTTVSDHRYNFDGLFVFTPSKSPCSTAQYFRTGGVELATMQFVHQGESRKHLKMRELEKWTIAFCDSFLKAIKRLGVSPPFAVMLSLYGVDGVKIEEGSEHILENEPTANRFDRKELLLPPRLIYDLDINIVDFLRPDFNRIWQSAGWEKSSFADKWKEPQA